MAATEALKGSSRHLIYMGRNEYKKCRNIPKLREFAELFSVPVCDFGDAIRHGFKAEPPPTPSLTTEEGRRINGTYDFYNIPIIFLQCSYDIPMILIYLIIDLDLYA